VKSESPSRVNPPSECATAHGDRPKQGHFTAGGVHSAAENALERRSEISCRLPVSPGRGAAPGESTTPSVAPQGRLRSLRRASAERIGRTDDAHSLPAAGLVTLATLITAYPTIVAVRALPPGVAAGRDGVLWLLPGLEADRGGGPCVCAKTMSAEFRLLRWHTPQRSGRLKGNVCRRGRRPAGTYRLRMIAVESGSGAVEVWHTGFREDNGHACFDFEHCRP